MNYSSLRYRLQKTELVLIHSAATYNYIRGGMPNSGFYLGTFHMSLVCDIIKTRKVQDQNPL